MSLDSILYGTENFQGICKFILLVFRILLANWEILTVYKVVKVILVLQIVF